jgi:hypothetical protein
MVVAGNNRRRSTSVPQKPCAEQGAALRRAFMPHCEMRFGNVLSAILPIATQQVWFSPAQGPKVAGKNKGRMNEIYAAKKGKSDIDWF